MGPALVEAPASTSADIFPPLPFCASPPIGPASCLVGSISMCDNGAVRVKFQHLGCGTNCWVAPCGPWLRGDRHPIRRRLRGTTLLSAPCRRGVVHRSGRSGRDRLRALQRYVRRILRQRGPEPGRGDVRLRQRWRPRHLHRAGPDARPGQDPGPRRAPAPGPAADGSPVSERPRGARRWDPHPALHGRHRGERPGCALLRHGRRSG